MSIIMRVVQQYDVTCEKEFMALEKCFAELEAARPDYPKGRRMKPIASSTSCNTLIWECAFPDILAAHKALDFFEDDAAHEALFQRQRPLIRSVHVEFYENLDFSGV